MYLDVSSEHARFHWLKAEGAGGVAEYFVGVAGNDVVRDGGILGACGQSLQGLAAARVAGAVGD